LPERFFDGSVPSISAAGRLDFLSSDQGGAVCDRNEKKFHRFTQLRRSRLTNTFSAAKPTLPHENVRINSYPTLENFPIMAKRTYYDEALEQASRIGAYTLSAVWRDYDSVTTFFEKG
jgi:hypothetical protein